MLVDQRGRAPRGRCRARRRSRRARSRARRRPRRRARRRGSRPGRRAPSSGRSPASRGRDRHQVRLGAGVREPHAVEPEALAHQPRKLGLVRVDAADARELRAWPSYRVEHAPLAVPEEPGGVVAEEVDVLVPVRVGEHCPLAADERERERLVREHRAGVPAGQHAAAPRRAAGALSGFRSANSRRARSSSSTAPMVVALTARILSAASVTPWSSTQRSDAMPEGV